MNQNLAVSAIQQALYAGIREFCVAPGKRNAPLIFALAKIDHIKIYQWPEERSAAFFALGRIRATNRPVAVIVTSGTAVGNLLPAAMEAHYTQLPLLLITADRPRRQRGTGAPQSAEQVGIFSHYTCFFQDLADNERCCLKKWSQMGAAHLNLCFEEPKEEVQVPFSFQFDHLYHKKEPPIVTDASDLKIFLKNHHFPIAVVGALPKKDQEAVTLFLQNLKIPIYVEAISGLREEPRLKELKIIGDSILQSSKKADYPIDSVMRIGSIPTCRLWRDLEEKNSEIAVYSISHLPFSGLSNSQTLFTSLKEFFSSSHFTAHPNNERAQKWLSKEKEVASDLKRRCKQEPTAQLSLLHQLSCLIPEGSLIYLGNSLSIREWDLIATDKYKFFKVEASRGLCGIDGQISTFLGLCTPEQENWAIIGDLTALYDLVAPWIYQQLPVCNVNLVIINNGGGQIFSKMFSLPIFLNCHQLHFKPLADLWG